MSLCVQHAHQPSRHLSSSPRCNSHTSDAEQEGNGEDGDDLSGSGDSSGSGNEDNDSAQSGDSEDGGDLHDIDGDVGLDNEVISLDGDTDNASGDDLDDVDVQFGQADGADDDEEEVQIVSSISGKQPQRQQQLPGITGVAREAPGVSRFAPQSDGRSSNAQPWWRRFPDFVPVEALRWGKNPRCPAL